MHQSIDGTRRGSHSVLIWGANGVCITLSPDAIRDVIAINLRRCTLQFINLINFYFNIHQNFYVTESIAQRNATFLYTTNLMSIASARRKQCHCYMIKLQKERIFHSLHSPKRWNSESRALSLHKRFASRLDFFLSKQELHIATQMFPNLKITSWLISALIVVSLCALHCNFHGRFRWNPWTCVVAGRDQLKTIITLIREDIFSANHFLLGTRSLFWFNIGFGDVKCSVHVLLNFTTRNSSLIIVANIFLCTTILEKYWWKRIIMQFSSISTIDNEMAMKRRSHLKYCRTNCVLGTKRAFNVLFSLCNI